MTRLPREKALASSGTRLAQIEIIIGEESHLDGFHLIRVEGCIHPGAVAEHEDA